MRLSVAAALALSIVSFGVGCSSTGGTAYRTGDLVLPAYSGPIAIYASHNPPPDASDLGLVEVHATEDEGTVQTLLPLFLEKVASLGGDVAVIDAVHARFEKTPRLQIDTYYATCASGVPCAGKHAYATNDEVMTVTMIGRAMSRKHAPPNAPRPDLLPPGPPTPPLPPPSSPPASTPESIEIGGPSAPMPAKPDENAP